MCSSEARAKTLLQPCGDDLKARPRRSDNLVDEQSIGRAIGKIFHSRLPFRGFPTPRNRYPPPPAARVDWSLGEVSAHFLKISERL